MTKVIVVEIHQTVNPWIRFINKNRLDKNNVPIVLIVDLRYIQFIRPQHIVPLSCLIEEYYLKGTEIKFKKGEGKTMQYLNQIGFFEYWKEGFDRGQYRRTELNTSLCLWKLNQEMIHAFVVYAQDYFQRNFFNGKDLQPLNTALAEIFNNIIDHSQSSVSGYVFTQYYPRKREIIISVCDFGNGIPYTVKEYLSRTQRREIENDKALQLAFKKGFSTRSTPSNRGFGLDNILSLTKSLKSRFLFISNNAYVEQQNHGNFVKGLLKNNFYGTQIVIYLKTSNLKRVELEGKEEFYL